MNIDVVADLPTEPGLYQVTGDGSADLMHHAITLRLSDDGQWRDATLNEILTPTRLQVLGAHHREGRLVRLVREDKVLATAVEVPERGAEAMLDRALQIKAQLDSLRDLQEELEAVVTNRGMDHPLYAKAQERIDALSRELAELS